jgi:ligand-binding sensor domain-containing protein
MKRCLLLIVVFMWCVPELMAQVRHEHFNNINRQNGLKDNIIYCMMKDDKGIMWVGTQNGLSRFDGTHFYNYYKKREGNSIPNNSIQCLCQGKDGTIWGGTDFGIFNYIPSKNYFATYETPKGSYNNRIFNIACDASGTIYATTSRELIRFNKAAGKFEPVIKFTEHEDSAIYYSTSKNRFLCDETNNGFWIATNAGLLFYDSKAGHIMNASNQPNNPLFARKNASALARSGNGYMWFSDNIAHEIIAFDPKERGILKTISYQKESPNAIITTLLEDRHNRLWVSSWKYDLLLIDLNNPAKIERILSQEGNNNTVAGQFFWAAMEDENSTIWLGTPNGLSLCNPGKAVYKSFHLPDVIEDLKSSTIYLFEEDPRDSTWWIVTTSYQIHHYHPKTRTCQSYSFNDFLPDRSGQKPFNIFNIRFINKLLLFTTPSGTWQFKPATGKFTPFQPVNIQQEGFIIKNLMQVDSTIYLTDGKTMLAWNTVNQQIIKIADSMANLDRNGINAYDHLMHVKNKSFSWTTHDFHLAFINKHQQVEYIKVTRHDSLENWGFFMSTDMDEQGNVWLINKGVGIYMVDMKTRKVRFWNEMDGLVDNHLHSIKADRNGNIWTIYFNKLSVLNPSKGTFVNFVIPYSEHNLNYLNSMTRRADGKVMGSVGNDMFEFDAANLNLFPVKKTPVISSFSVSGNNYFPDNGSSMKFDPNENSITFRFGLLIDDALFPYQMTYMLEGSDKQWVVASKSNEVTYNNLAPGSYTFRLVAKGKNHNWQSAEKVLHITIRTPFYKTIWFVAILIFIFASALFMLYRYRLAQNEKVIRLENQAQLLEKEKTMVMYENLKQQLNPHFLFNSLTSLSGLIETDQELAVEFLEQMSGIYRYILQNGNLEKVSLKAELQFVKLYVNLQQTRFSEGLQVNIEIPPEEFDKKVAPVSVQNLIENAIKHNIIDASSPLLIRIYVEGNYLLISNNLQRKSKVETSNKKGLLQLVTLYEYLSDLPVLIEETETDFKIKLPLL